MPPDDGPKPDVPQDKPHNRKQRRTAQFGQPQTGSLPKPSLQSRTQLDTVKAVSNIRRFLRWLQSPPSSDPPPWLQTILRFLEHNLVTLPLGILGGVGGVLFPVMTYLCVGCFLLALHRTEVVKGRTRAVQLCAYVGLLVIGLICFHIFNVKVQQQLADSNTALAKLVARYVSPSASPQQASRIVNDKSHDDLAKEFPLGYKLFGLGKIDNEFFPFQGTPDVGFIVHWEKRNYSFTWTDENLTLHLPDIDIQPNMMLHETTVVLPNKTGSNVTFRLDPKSFQRGAAIVSNSFERTDEQNLGAVKPTGGTFEEGFPSTSRIVYLMQSTVNWGGEDYYQLGEIGVMGDTVKVTGGVLGTSRVNVFTDAVLIRGNKFVGGPRGGYEFPKAATVLGNVFLNSMFDASRMPDGAIVASNRFVSPTGVYRIGPQPEISFVVKIVQTEKNGAVLLFGAKPYQDDEGSQ
jgi:hypothetical protein